MQLMMAFCNGFVKGHAKKMFEISCSSSLQSIFCTPLRSGETMHAPGGSLT